MNQQGFVAIRRVQPEKSLAACKGEGLRNTAVKFTSTTSTLSTQLLTPAFHHLGILNVRQLESSRVPFMVKGVSVTMTMDLIIDRTMHCFHARKYHYTAKANLIF